MAARALAAALLLASSLALSVYALRTAAAAWLVFPSPAIWTLAPTEDPDSLATAAALAPGEASYAAYRADLLFARARADGLAEATDDRFTAAWAEASRAVALQPTNPAHRLRSGRIALARALLPGQERVGEWMAQARQAFAHTRQLAPTMPLFHRLVGLELLRAWPALDEAGRSECIAALRQATLLAPDTAAIALQSLIGRLGVAGALAELEDAVPADSRAWTSAAGVLEAEARRRTGEARARPALELASLRARRLAMDSSSLAQVDVEAWLAAWSRLGAGHAAEHLEAARAASREHPAHPAGPLALAALHETAGDVTGARLDYDEAIARARAWQAADRQGDRRLLPLAMALDRRGDFLASTGIHQDHEKAASDYAELARLQPTNTWATIRHARQLEALGRDAEAAAALQTAIRSSPRDAGLRAELARRLAGSRDWLESIAEWRMVVSLQPGNDNARLEIARAYRQLGIGDQAVVWYTRVLDSNPDNAAVRGELDSLLREMGR